MKDAIAAEVRVLQPETKDLDELGPGAGVIWLHERDKMGCQLLEKDIRKVACNLEVCYKQRS